MGKHIAKFENDAAIQAAVDNFILMKPYIAMDEANTSIDFDTKLKTYQMSIKCTYMNQGRRMMMGNGNIISYSFNDDTTIYPWTGGTDEIVCPIEIADPTNTTIYFNLNGKNINTCGENLENSKELRIGEGIERINDFILYGGYETDYVELPSTLQYLGGGLWGCTYVNTIVCKATTAPELGVDCNFNVADTGTLYIPSGSDYSTWLAKLPAGWTTANI